MSTFNSPDPVVVYDAWNAFWVSTDGTEHSPPKFYSLSQEPKPEFIASQHTQRVMHYQFQRLGSTRVPRRLSENRSRSEGKRF
jgi:hypothetical protein